ncbi:hypothetical protein C8R45DRAFT_1151461 [Mycena sanguinolenta]|nr:hypothetical protein C8R45DRAFT_1151461 [Mycena sanguinolenta]
MWIFMRRWTKTHCTRGGAPDSAERSQPRAPSPDSRAPSERRPSCRRRARAQCQRFHYEEMDVATAQSVQWTALRPVKGTCAGDARDDDVPFAWRGAARLCTSPARDFVLTTRTKARLRTMPVNRLPTLVKTVASIRQRRAHKDWRERGHTVWCPALYNTGATWESFGVRARCRWRARRRIALVFPGGARAREMNGQEDVNLPFTGPYKLSEVGDAANAAGMERGGGGPRGVALTCGGSASSTDGSGARCVVEAR